MDSLPFLEYWYAGLKAKIGVRVRTTTGAARLKAALYKVRTEANDPDLQTLALVTSRTDPANEVWIVHKSITVETPEDLDAT